MALTREKFIAAAQDKRRMEEIPVPELGDTVFVRELSAAERDQFETSMLHLSKQGKVQGTNLANLRARLAVLAICDEQGRRLFSDDDAKILGQLGASALQRIFEAAQRLSGLSDSDMEELEKNSVSGPSGDSSSS